MMTEIKPVGELLRGWRQRRRMSQLDLACGVGISPGQLSSLESGRIAPSSDLLLRMTDRLEVPLRDRNALLVAAGLPAVYTEHGLDDADLAAARSGLLAMLAGHEPNPALVIDQHWTLAHANDTLMRLISGADPMLLRPPINVVRLILHPAGLAPRVSNLPLWRAQIIARLEAQIERTGETSLSDLLEEVRDYPALRVPSGRTDEEADSAAVPFRLASVDGLLSFYSLVSLINAPLDITLADLRLIALLPADGRTADVMRRQAQQAAERAPLAAVG
jgi:transcriptional regulator with XRE-family HTH domain